MKISDINQQANTMQYVNQTNSANPPDTISGTQGSRQITLPIFSRQGGAFGPIERDAKDLRCSSNDS